MEGNRYVYHGRLDVGSMFTYIYSPENGPVVGRIGEYTITGGIPMHKCSRCGGTKKLYRVSAKCSDLYSHQHLNAGTEYDGYVPDWIGRFGDYVEFTICRHCGQVQGDWPEANADMGPFKSGKVV